MSGNYLRELLPVALVVLAFVLAPAQLLAYERAPQRPAIVLAAFGTTEVAALPAILNVERKVKAAFPGHDVHLAFTSNIIRQKWRQRAADARFREDNPQIPAEVYEIGNPLTALARIQEDGGRDVFVQSLHTTNGTEYGDLKALVESLARIKTFQESKRPFPYLVLGESVLGEGGKEDLNRAAKALAPLVAEAQRMGGALVLMGHGNEEKDVQSYRQFNKALNAMYGTPIFIGLVEGQPKLEAVLAELRKTPVKNVLLAPMMLVAGDHAHNDMAGPGADSWLGALTAAGYKVTPRLEGLGQSDGWADIFVERLKTLVAAHDAK